MRSTRYTLAALFAALAVVAGYGIDLSFDASTPDYIMKTRLGADLDLVEAAIDRIDQTASNALPAANATYTGTVGKAATAIQPTTPAYTAAVAQAASALQPNAVSSTNVFYWGADNAHTVTVITLYGQITSWTSLP